MAIIQQEPTFNQRSADIAQRRALAKALREQAQYDMPPNAEVRVGPYSRVVKTSPLAALAQGLRAGYSSYLDSEAAKEAAALEDRKLKAVSDAFNNGQFDYSKAAESGAFDPQTLVKLLSDRDMKRQQMELQQQMIDYKNQQPTINQRDALIASGGDEELARKLMQNKFLNPLGILNYQLQKENVAADNSRAEQQLALQKEAAQRSEQQFALQNEAAKRAQEKFDNSQANTDYSAELANWRLMNPNYEKNQKEIAAAEANYEKLKNSLDSYYETLKKYDQIDRHNPMANADLQTAYQQATWPLRSDEMMNTGVLNPGEMPMLNKALTDPTGIFNPSSYRGYEELEKQKKTLLDTALKNVESKRKALSPNTMPPLKPGASKEEEKAWIEKANKSDPNAMPKQEYESFTSNPGNQSNESEKEKRLQELRKRHLGQ